MATPFQELAEEIAEALSGSGLGFDASRMDFDDADEIVVEHEDGRRCLLIVQTHWEDE